MLVVSGAGNTCPRLLEMTSSSLLAVVLRGAILACVVIFFAFTIVKPLNWYLLGPWFIQARSRVAINYFDVVQYQGDPTGKAPRGGEWAFEVGYLSLWWTLSVTWPWTCKV